MAVNSSQAPWAGTTSAGQIKRFQVAQLRPTERLFIEKTLLKMYPHLQKQDLFPWNLLHGPLIPDFLVRNTSLQLRRILIIGCGDGVLCNILSLLFPTIEIVGVDASSSKIAAARATVGHRQNLKFVCGNPVNMLEIPCDRIIYDRCLGQLGDSVAFKKLMAKTLRWLVPSGDFMVREAPLQLLKHPRLLRAFWPQIRRRHHLEAGIHYTLNEMGYAHPQVYLCRRLPGIVSEVYYHCPKMPGQGMTGAQQEAVQEWQDVGDQSTNSVLGFLFSQSANDFSRELR
jgi:SAM-dependent methyltransferase